jgi:hypothetical protein
MLKASIPIQPGQPQRHHHGSSGSSSERTITRHKAIMDARMRKCLDATVAAHKDIPPTVNALRFVLTMPNLLRHLQFISRLIERTRLTHGMKRWKRLCMIGRLRRQHSVKRIQVSWREAVVRKSEKIRKKNDEAERKRKMEHAVRLIQINLYKRLIYMRIHHRGRKKRERNAIVLQRVFRGFVVRCKRIDDVRIHLVQLLRRWAQGCTDKLLTNPCKHTLTVYCCG